MTESQTKILNDQHFDKTFTAEYEGSVTGATVLTPSSGKSIAVKGILVTMEPGGAVTSRLRLYFDNDEDSNENTLFIAYIFGATSGWIPEYVPLLLKGDPDEPIKIDATMDAGDNYFVLINYREE